MFDSLIAYLDAVRASWRLADFLDVGVIALLIYFGLTWLRRRASRPILITIAAVAALWAVSHALNMYLTLTLTQVGMTVVVLALILIFQEDIRRALERLGSWHLFHWHARLAESYSIIDTLILALAEFSDQKIGALIVLKGREPLDRYVRGGVPLGAAVTIPLLHSLFQRHSPGHDGAAIIVDGRLDRFGVILPLSNDLDQIGRLVGTRHAAALGLAERSDALVIVASEETGVLSVAERGEIEQFDTPTQLKTRLQQYFQETFPPPDQPRWHRPFTRNLPAKFASAAAALALWLLFAFQIETLQRTYLVPIEYRSLPANYALDQFRPIQARVTLSGSQRSFNLLNPDALVISMDASDIREGFQELVVQDRNLNHPGDLAIDHIQPRLLGINAYRMREAQLPIQVRTRGTLSDHLTLVETQVHPSTARVQFRQNEQPERIWTEPVDLNQIRQTTSMELRLLPPDDARLISPDPATVRAVVQVAEKQVAEREGR